jgi:hypothetical protein
MKILQLNPSRLGVLSLYTDERKRMSTRAIVAEPHGDSWRGRHTHSDGYPSGRGQTLWALVARDGVETVRKTIIHTYFGWSSIDPTQQDFIGVPPDQNAPYGSPAYDAYMFSPGGMYGDGRFVVVPGYGVAYTTAGPAEGVRHGPQSSEDEWFGPHEQYGFSDKEWAYVLADDALWVLKLPWNGTEATLIATCRWDASEPNWEVMESMAYPEEEEAS